MGSPSRTTRTFTVSFPPELAEQVELTAKAENRTTSELFREAFRRYRAERAGKIFRESQDDFAGSNSQGYTEADVPRLVKEHRVEKRSRKR